MKSRLGLKPYDYGQHARGQRHYGPKMVQFRQDEESMRRKMPDYSQVVCYLCGMEGYIKKKCYKLKNLERDAVNFIDSYRPGPSADRHLSELLERMQVNNSDEEEIEKRTDWKN